MVVTVPSVEDAAREADRIRASIWGDRFPVDPVRIARQLGIDVLDAELAANVAGALLKEPGEDPVILLNSTDSPNRKRFTCAHEIGHFVLRSAEPEQYEYVDYRNALSATGAGPEEVYSNRFAACLLMPEKEVRGLASEGRTELELALHFDVSREAMHYRLDSLGLA